MSEYVQAIQVVVVVDESERNLEADVGLVNIRILVSEMKIYTFLRRNIARLQEI